MAYFLDYYKFKHGMKLCTKYIPLKANSENVLCKNLC